MLFLIDLTFCKNRKNTSSLLGALWDDVWSMLFRQFQKSDLLTLTTAMMDDVTKITTELETEGRWFGTLHECMNVCIYLFIYLFMHLANAIIQSDFLLSITPGPVSHRAAWGQRPCSRAQLWILTYSFQATYCSMSTMFLPHYSTLPPYPYPFSMFIWYSTLTRPWTLWTWTDMNTDIVNCG